jgi:hypothetical protein
MPVKNPKELFVTILSQVRHGTERSAAIYKDWANWPRIRKYRRPSKHGLSCLSKP